jgi:hypothetical protein
MNQHSHQTAPTQFVEAKDRWINGDTVRIDGGSKL